MKKYYQGEESGQTASLFMKLFIQQDLKLIILNGIMLFEEILDVLNSRTIANLLQGW